MNNILDVKNFHFNILDIKEHSKCFGESRIEETPERQQDLLKTYQQNYLDLQSRYKLPPQTIRENTFKRIQYMVEYAFENVPFYQDFYGNVGFCKGDLRTWADFEKLPILTKSMLRDHFPKNVAKDFDPDKLYGVRTSGSSGIPLTVVLDDHRAHIDTLHRIRQFEILAGQTIPTDSWLYNIHHSGWWYTSMQGLYPTFSLRQDCPLESMTEHILKLKPSVISGLPSVLMDLAVYLQQKNIILKDYGILCVSTNSEASSWRERRRMQDIFGVPVGDEYSSEELGLIATECYHSQYHLVEDECYIEILNLTESQDGFGSVIGTDLWNIAMPILRYDQGDLAKSIRTSTCACGSLHRILHDFQGRNDQNFTNATGQMILSSQLMDACDEFLVPPSSNIQEFKLIQKTLNHIQLLCTKSESSLPLNETLLKFFSKKVTALFGHDIYLETLVSDELPENASYKRRMLISEITQNRK